MSIALISSTATPVSRPLVLPSFAELYDGFFPFIWRSTRRLGIPDSALEDVVQEVFVVIYQKLPAFEGRGTLRSWIFSVVLRVVRAQRRALLRKHPLTLRPADPTDLDLLPDLRDAGPHEAMAKREAETFLGVFLASLDDEKREVFILAELEQMTAPEISAAVEANVNTVYSRLRLARAAFVEAVARHLARDARRLA